MEETLCKKNNRNVVTDRDKEDRHLVATVNREIQNERESNRIDTISKIASQIDELNNVENYDRDSEKESLNDEKVKKHM